MKNNAVQRAYLLTVGEELLVGDTINTNAAWLGSLLTRNGIPVAEAMTVPDQDGAIRDALTRYLTPGSLVLSTGGLGPTHDDITKTTLLSFFGVGLKRDEESLARNRAYFESRGIPFSPSNFGQSDVPENADVLQNLAGTAQGFWIEWNGALLIVMPGVPREMKHLMDVQVMPRLEREGRIASASHIRYFKTMGIGESTLSDMVLEGLPRFLEDSRISLAFLPQSMGVNLRVIGRAPTRQEAEACCRPLEEFIRNRAAAFIYSEQLDETPAAALGRSLAAASETISFAESCTGGLFSALHTDIPGASAWFTGAVVAYSNEVKKHVLQVPAAILDSHGAVSAPTAAAMARGVRKLTGSTWAISATGIAGPDGGTTDKPVGTVWVGISGPKGTRVFHAVFGRDRKTNRERTVYLAMEVLRRLRQGITDMPFSVQLETVD